MKLAATSQSPTVSDIIRLKRELKILWDAIFEEVVEQMPDASWPDRREAARSRFLGVVDDAVREVAESS